MTDKVTPIPEKMNTTKKNVKITHCDDAGKKRTPEENWAENSEEIHFEFMSRGTPEQNGVIEQRSYSINYHINLIMESILSYGPNAWKLRLKLKSLWSIHMRKYARTRSSTVKWNTKQNTSEFLDKYELYTVLST